MKHLLTVFLFISSSTFLIAGKANTYDLNLVIVDGYSGEPLSGISISFESKSGKFKEKTDVNGMLSFQGLKEKSIQFSIEDEGGQYDERTHFYSNYDRISENDTVRLRWSESREMEYGRTQDSLYSKIPEVAFSMFAYSDFIDAPENQKDVKVPEFEGGKDALYWFIGKNLRFPPIAKEKGKSGKCQISFVIREDGTVTNPRIERSFMQACDEECIRVVRHMPKWIPAEIEGMSSPVRVHMEMSFILR